MQKYLNTNRKLLFFVSFTTIFFLFILAFDFTPLLRGPHDSIIASQWPYYFVNTFENAWVFIPIYFLFIFLIHKVNAIKKFDQKKEVVILACLVVLVLFFQLALVYFSRFGITVLFRRLVDPGINGYFTTAINIHNSLQFLNSFPDYINGRILSQHASGHPPGAVLLIKWFLDICSVIPSQFFSFLINIHPNWAKDLWNSLELPQKFAGITLPFLLHVLSSLVIIPFYFVAKELLNDSRTAFKTTILYGVIPSLSFFALIFDPFYAVFPLLSTFFILKGVKKRDDRYFPLAGLACGIGLFFTAAIITYIIGLFVLVLISNKTVLIKYILKFLMGIIFVICILFLLGFNLFASLTAVIQNQASREYLSWVIYNPFDFFVFMGFPLSILFFLFTWQVIRNPKVIAGSLKYIYFTFWITFIMLNLSGASRGEVGRIWLPFMFVPILLVGNYIHKVRFSNKQLILIFTLIFIQTIIMEEFWVPIW